MLVNVPVLRTSISHENFVKSLITIWENQFNTLPSKGQVAIIYAQWGIETGYSAYCYNYNIGNVKAIDNPNEYIEYMKLNNVWEIINGKKVIIPPDNPGAWFRSFPSLNDGMAFHLSFLQQRYKGAWQSILDGDPNQFVHKLKESGYFTASEDAYKKAVISIYSSFMKDTLYDRIITDHISFKEHGSESYPIIEDEVLRPDRKDSWFDHLVAFLVNFFTGKIR